MQTHHDSQHATVEAHRRPCIFSGAPTVSRQFSSRARIESRSGVGVGIDAVSTTVKRLFNGDARRRSLAMPSMCHALGDGSRRAAAGAKRSARSRSSRSFFFDATLTVARGRVVRVRLSWWRWERSIGTSAIVFSDQIERGRKTWGVWEFLLLPLRVSGAASSLDAAA